MIVFSFNWAQEKGHRKTSFSYIIYKTVHKTVQLIWKVIDKMYQELMDIHIIKPSDTNFAYIGNNLKH